MPACMIAFLVVMVTMGPTQSVAMLLGMFNVLVAINS